MASSGKKGKNKKGKTVSLNDFLSKGSANGGPDTTTVVMPSASWADEMDEDDNSSSKGYATKPEAFVLPTAPRAARGPDMSDDRIPRDPPFTAYIANLSYDVDTEVVMSFFSKLKIKGVRLPRDGDAETGRLKGFGYADFEDRESLVEALNMNDHLLQNRKLRVDLATHAGRGTERPSFNDRGGGRYGDRGGEEDDRTAGDWRSGPPPPARENDRDRGYDRGGSDRRGDRDGTRGFDRYEPPRDRNSYDRDDRRDGNRGYGFSRDDRGFGGDRYRRDDNNRDDGGFDRRDRGGYDRNTRHDDRNRSSPEAPKERPRLQLKPRSDRTASSEEKETSSKSSIFGAAKPVDTAKKEAEIDQKLQETQPRVRTIDLASKRRDEEERRRSSEREKDDKTTSEIHKNTEDIKPQKPNIFGSATPVDTSAREKEIEEKLKKQNLSKSAATISRKPDDSNQADEKDTSLPVEEKVQSQTEKTLSRSCDEDDNKRPTIEIKKPTSSDIFGSAKPNEKTRIREKEIEEKMKAQRVGGQGADHDSSKRNERESHDSLRRDERNNHGRNRIDRDYDNRRTGGDRNFDRRDGPRDRHTDDKRDTDRKGITRDHRNDKKPGSDENRRDTTPPPMKKFEEAKVPNFAGSNKFSFLQDDDEVGSGKGSDSE